MTQDLTPPPGYAEGALARTSAPAPTGAETDGGRGALPAGPDADRPSRPPWYRWLRKPLVVGPVVVVVAFAVWFFAIRSDGTSSSTAATATTTTKQLVTVTRGSLTSNVSAEGTVAAAQTDNLSFGSAGTVTAVNVKAGDTVTAGEVLATINSASLQSNVSAAASTLAKAQATLSDDESSGASSDQIAADQANVTSATDSLTTAWQALAGSSLVATFNGTVASVNLTVGEQLASGGTGGTTPTGSGTGSGQSSSSLGSSNSGGFGGGNNSNSSSSSSSTAQIQVVSKGSYTVSLPVGSSDIDSIKAGDAVTLTVSTSSSGGFGGGGFRQFFRAAGGGGGNGNGNAGTGNAGNGNTGTGGNRSGAGTAVEAASTTGTVSDVGRIASATSGVAQYPVTVAFTTDNAQFSVGTTVTGAVATVLKTDVLQVPDRAVTTTNGKSTVTVALAGKVNGRTATRTVTTGQSAGGMIEITGGLQEGDQVIVVTVVPKALTSGNGTGATFPGGGQFPGFGTRGAGTGTGTGNGTGGSANSGTANSGTGG